MPLFNPIARRLLGVGLPMGPNALLTVRGRTTGQLRTTPVALVDVDGRRWVIGTFGDVNWVKNLRAAGEGVITIKRQARPVRAVELTPAEATAFFTQVVAPYVGRIPMGRVLLGSLLGARDILDDPAGAGLRHPVFELRPR